AVRGGSTVWPAGAEPDGGPDWATANPAHTAPAHRLAIRAATSPPARGPAPGSRRGPYPRSPRNPAGVRCRRPLPRFPPPPRVLPWQDGGRGATEFWLPICGTGLPTGAGGRIVRTGLETCATNERSIETPRFVFGVVRANRIRLPGRVVHRGVRRRGVRRRRQS